MKIDNINCSTDNQWSCWSESSDKALPADQCLKPCCMCNRQSFKNNRIRIFVTSLYPDMFPELGGHANQKSITAGCQNLMEVVTTTTNNLYTNRVGPLMENSAMNYLHREPCCHLLQCGRSSVAHLNNLLTFCWSNKVSKNFFDNVFAFGGLWHCKPWDSANSNSWEDK